MKTVFVSITVTAVAFFGFGVFLTIVARDAFGPVGLAVGFTFIGVAAFGLLFTALLGLVVVLNGRSHSDVLVASADADAARWKAFGQFGGAMKEAMKGARADQPQPEELTIYSNPMGQPMGQYGPPRLDDPGQRRALPMFPDEMPAEMQQARRQQSGRDVFVS